MKKTIIALLLLSILLVTGCGGGKISIIERGTIKETKDVLAESAKDLGEGIKSLGYTDWSAQKISIPENGSQIIYSNFKENSNGQKKIICEFVSDKPINIYAIPSADLESAKNGGSVSIYTPCSSENTLKYDCSDTCVVPLDTIFFIRNKNLNFSANVDINLKYKVQTPNS